MSSEIAVEVGAMEAEMREWWEKKHNPDCECEVGLAWLEAIAWFRALRTARGES